MDKIRALVVDDEEPLRGILKISLNYFGVDVVGEAENGEQAVEKYKELSPSVVIMDVNMPVMDGLEALSEIKKYDKNAVVIIITASDDENMKLEGIKAGCRGFLHKPLKMDELHQDILTNLRIYFAQQKGEKLEDDYFRYVVKPDFRPDSIREQQGLPARPGVRIPDQNAADASSVAKAAASTDVPPHVSAEPASASPTPPVMPSGGTDSSLDKSSSKSVTASGATDPLPGSSSGAGTVAQTLSASDATLVERIEDLQKENSNLRNKLDRAARSLKGLLAELDS